MENSIAYLIFNSASLEVHNGRAEGANSRKSAFALASMSLSQLENPIVSELLPLALYFDLSQQFSTAHGAFSFMRYYRQDIRRRRLASLNVLLRAYFGVRSARFLASTFDHDEDARLYAESERDWEFSPDGARGVLLENSVRTSRFLGDAMHNSVFNAGGSAFDGGITPARAKMYYFRMLQLNTHISRQVAQFLASFVADDDTVRLRFCLSLLGWLAHVRRRFARIESHFVGSHAFVRHLRENVAECRGKSFRLAQKLAGSLQARESAVSRPCTRACPYMPPQVRPAQSLPLPPRRRVHLGAAEQQKILLLLPKLLAVRAPRRLDSGPGSGSGLDSTESPDSAIERCLCRALECKVLNALQDAAYREISRGIFAARCLRHCFLLLRRYANRLQAAEVKTYDMVRAGKERRALSALRLVAGYKMAEKSSLIERTVSVLRKRTVFTTWVAATAARRLAAHKAALWRTERDMALLSRALAACRAYAVWGAQRAKFYGRVNRRIVMQSFGFWGSRAHYRAALRRALNAACARYLRAYLREKLESSVEFIFQTKCYVFRRWRAVVLQTKLARAAQQMEELAGAARSRYLQHHALSHLYAKILTASEKERLIQHFLARQRAFASLAGWRRLLFSDAAAASFFRASYCDRTLKTKVFTALQEILHVQRLYRLQALKVQCRAFYELVLCHERMQRAVAELAGVRARELYKATFDALCDSMFGLKQKENDLLQRHQNRILAIAFARWFGKAAYLAQNGAILQKERVLYVFRIWDSRLTARRLRALAALRGRRAALYHYFKAWMAFTLRAKRAHLIQAKKALFYQELLGKYAAAVLAGGHSKSLVRYEHAVRIAASVAKAGLRAPLPVRYALAVEEFRLLLRAFVAWRWRLRVASQRVSWKV